MTQLAPSCARIRQNLRFEHSIERGGLVLDFKGLFLVFRVGEGRKEGNQVINVLKGFLVLGWDLLASE